MSFVRLLHLFLWGELIKSKSTMFLGVRDGLLIGLTTVKRNADMP